MDLNQLDLNLLRIFNQLMLERRVSTVAETLGVSQPAVSNALKRLRTLFNDELFLRTAHGMEPTTLAEQLSEPIAYAFDTLRAAVHQQAGFDPATATRDFTLGLNDLGETYFLPPLLERVVAEAPGVTITTIRNTNVSLREDMEQGRVDVAIGLLPQLQGSLFRQRLYRERFVCAMRSDHPLAKCGPLTQKAFEEAEHVVVVSTGTGHGEVDRMIERKGIRRKVRVTLPHFNAVGQILCSTNLLATLPSRMATMIANPFDLVYLAHPVTLPDVSIDIFWHARVHRDPGNQWLRRIVFELFSELPQSNAG